METDNETMLRFRAMELECKFFSDMTLEDYPELTETLDRWGDCHNPTVDRARFKVLDSDDYSGQFDPESVTISVALDADDSTLAHEMIHYYEHAIDKINSDIAQLLTVDLWQKLQEHIPDLRDRVLRHLEIVDLKELEHVGGQHDVLFLLKSFDIDLSLNLALGTTFGYGYAGEYGLRG